MYVGRERKREGRKVVPCREGGRGDEGREDGGRDGRREGRTDRWLDGQMDGWTKEGRRKEGGRDMNR